LPKKLAGFPTLGALLLGCRWKGALRDVHGHPSADRVSCNVRSRLFCKKGAIMGLQQYLRCLRSYLTGRQTGNVKRPATFRRSPTRLHLELLEDRTVLSTINWVNEYDPANNFDSTFGSRAALARRVVEAAIDSWAHVITNFHTTTNTLSVTINMGPGGNNTIVTDSENGIPTAATINLDVGQFGDAAYAYLDPTVPSDPNQFNPVDSNYLGTNQNAFACEPTVYDASLRDFYTLTLHEMGHAVGFTGEDTQGNALLLASTPYAHDVTVPPGNPTGDEYVFQGPDVTTLLTSDNGGTSNAGAPIHAEYYTSTGTYNGQTVIGSDDLMTPGLTTPERRLISDSDALVLKDIYGYDIVRPDTLNNFYIGLGTNGQLTVRGNQFVDASLGYNASNDQINLTTP
jgi:hypothetical protein